MKNYYQAKYEYYRTIHLWIIIAACVSSVFYFLSDIYLYHRFTLATFPARIAILVPLAIFLYLYFHTDNYIIMITAGYIASHCIMLNTIWASFHLDDLSFTCSGFLIINMIFLAAGITAPVPVAIFAHGLLFVDITVANIWLHYPAYDMMLLLGIPLYLGICAFYIAIDHTYRDQYNIKNKLEYTIRHDALTDAYNRNIIDELTGLDGRLKDFAVGEAGVFMCDIDLFKNVNDTYGHSIGDTVLVKIASLIQANISESDYMIRWGGEEFVVIISGSPEHIRHTAEKIRSDVERENIPTVGHVTISIGVAIYDGMELLKTVNKADKALYQAKETGRNKVVC